MKKIKNIILATAATVALCSSSMAFAAAQDTFYGKVAVKGTRLAKNTLSVTAGKDPKAVTAKKAEGANFKYKLKSDTSFAGDVEVGYYFMENVRIGLAYSKYFNPSLKKTQEIDNNATQKVDNTIKSKINAHSLMLNGYVDVADLSMAKIFVGAGAGMSQVSAKVNFSASETDKANGNKVTNTSPSIKLKKSNNFAYKLTTGLAVEMAPNVYGEVFYAWEDLGKTKDYSGDLGKINKISVKGHTAGLGIRFDF